MYCGNIINMVHNSGGLVACSMETDDPATEEDYRSGKENRVPCHGNPDQVGSVSPPM